MKEKSERKRKRDVNKRKAQINHSCTQFIFHQMNIENNNNNHYRKEKKIINYILDTDIFSGQLLPVYQYSEWTLKKKRKKSNSTSRNFFEFSSMAHLLLYPGCNDISSGSNFQNNPRNITLSVNKNEET